MFLRVIPQAADMAVYPMSTFGTSVNLAVCLDGASFYRRKDGDGLHWIKQVLIILLLVFNWGFLILSIVLKIPPVLNLLFLFERILLDRANIRTGPVRSAKDSSQTRHRCGRTARNARRKGAEDFREAQDGLQTRIAHRFREEERTPAAQLYAHRPESRPLLHPYRLQWIRWSPAAVRCFSCQQSRFQH